MATSQILGSVGFTKTQKSRYLVNETLFFLQIKKNALITHQELLYCKNSFAVEVAFDIKTKIWQRFLKHQR